MKHRQLSWRCFSMHFCYDAVIALDRSDANEMCVDRAFIHLADLDAF
jgi:hypothetical protein